MLKKEKEKMNVRNGLKPFPTYGLSEIVRGFKTFSSKYINKKNQNINSHGKNLFTITLFVTIMN